MVQGMRHDPRSAHHKRSASRRSCAGRLQVITIAQDLGQLIANNVTASDSQMSVAFQFGRSRTNQAINPKSSCCSPITLSESLPPNDSTPSTHSRR